MGSPEDPYYNRRLRGTRVYNMRHRIVLSVMGAGGLIGVIYHFLPVSHSFSKWVLKEASRDHQFFREKKMILSHSLPIASSDDIREQVKEEEDRPM